MWTPNKRLLELKRKRDQAKAKPKRTIAAWEQQAMYRQLRRTMQRSEQEAGKRALERQNKAK